MIIGKLKGPLSGVTTKDGVNIVLTCARCKKTANWNLPMPLNDEVKEAKRIAMLRLHEENKDEIVYPIGLGRRTGGSASDIIRCGECFRLLCERCFTPSCRFCGNKWAIGAIDIFIKSNTSSIIETDTKVEKLIAQFGKNKPEDRQSDMIDEGIKAANSSKWEEAVRVFRNVLNDHPDYDAPYVWLADFVKQREGALKAVELLQNAARKTLRKSKLLGRAGELTLLECRNVRNAIHFLAQSIYAMVEAPDFASQEELSCLYMKEIFRVFEDTVGERWAANISSGITRLEDSVASEVHRSISYLSADERNIVKTELPQIRAILIREFPLRD